MMGRTHVFSGMAAGAAALPLAPAQGLAETFGWVAVCGGAAMLPDLDHRHATITRTWGPISYLVHKAVCWAGRGHRGGSHDPLVAPIVVGLVAWAGSFNPVTAGVLVAFAIGIAIRAVEFVIPGRAFETALMNLALSIPATWLIVTHAQWLGWLPWALALGVAVHIAGDAITRSGVPRPLSWLDGTPDSNTGPLTTGRWYEAWLIAPGFMAATALLLWLQVPELSALTNKATALLAGL